MSTDDPDERILTIRRRRASVDLPTDPTDEELTRDWTLGESDLRESLRCRGDGHRLWFALQLCVLRQHGRFLSAETAPPMRIVNHLLQQLGLAPTLFVQPPQREATEVDQEQRIRDYLGYTSFESDAQSRLMAWLSNRATGGTWPADLYDEAEAVLRSWKVQLPAPSTLERLVASVFSRERQRLFERLAHGLTATMRGAIDALLQVPDGSHQSVLFQLKEYPGEAKSAEILLYMERYRLLESMNVSAIDVSELQPSQVWQWAQLVKRYKAKDLRRFPPDKRYALMAGFLVETRKTILDHLVALHDQYVGSMYRQSRNAFEKEHRNVRKRAHRSLRTVLDAVEILLDRRVDEAVVAEFYATVDEPALRAAVDTCRALERLESNGVFDRLRARYSHLRRYLPAFFELPFEGEPGTEPLLTALDLIRKLDGGAIRNLPSDAPVDFVPDSWRAAWKGKDESPDRTLWEIALAFAVRDALRSGDLYLSGSRRHVSFGRLVYDDARWKKERDEAYRDLTLPQEADHAIAQLKALFHRAAGAAEIGVARNTFATVREGRLKLARRDALEVPESVRALRRVLETHLPKVRIENVLDDVDSWCGLTKAFQPVTGYEPRADGSRAALLATVVAHGTNLGISAMGHSAEGIGVQQLQAMSKWLLREDTIKAANAAVVNFHHGLDLSFTWGDGTTSSSDGQRFGVRASSLLASYYPRYFGYYDRALTVLTHSSDQHSVFGTRVISCSPREAQYVLDGLLENNTVLRPREHYTDTHGYTEHMFGLCYLLGISFAPRLRDLADQQLYRVDRDVSYAALDAVFRETIDTNLILEQWDELVRVASSLARRTAPAHVVVQRLAGGSPANRLAKALTALGRIIKTAYILRYIEEEDLRSRVQLQLNRGESRHELARWLFFANQGEFRTGDYEEIMNKASCLSLLSNTVLVWNTVQIQRIVRQLRTSGEVVSEEALAHVSPLLHAHVIPSGTYHFDQIKQGDNFAHNTLP